MLANSLYPEGNTPFYTKWVSGVLGFYRRSDATKFYSIDGVNRSVKFNLGTSQADPVTNSDALNYSEMYIKNTATTGWPTGFYVSTEAAGAGGQFTSLEGDAHITAAVADMTGVESFMDFGSAAGYVTGHAAAGQFTVDFPNRAIGGNGAYMAGRFNMKGEGSSCDVSTPIRMSCIELQTQGTFKGSNGFQDHAHAYAIYVNGFTPGAGGVLNSTSFNWGGAHASVVGLRVGVGADGAAGAVYYIPLVPAASWS